jgi:SH3 domain-containing YSC84-like protein 1
MKILTCVAVAVLAVATTASAELNSNEVSRLSEAAQVLRETRASIPQNYWERARCVAVIPDLKKAALIFGGEYGKGVMSCRAGDGWSAPVFMELAKGSWGFQAGAEEIDVVLLVMNENGVQKLLKNKVTLGADASVAAGPVGRQGQVGTDVSLTAEILAYSRAKGLFAGINLSGGVLRPDEDANRNAYGSNASPATILASRSISAPTQATPFLEALGSAANAQANTAATNSQGAADRQGPPATTPSANVPSSIDSDLRTTIVAMQQTLDRMLNDQNSTTVGTSGQAGNTGATVVVSRDRLEQLRSQIDALLAALNARGQ